MKVFANVALELDFSKEDAEEIKKICKNNNTTIKFHFLEKLEGILVNEADIPPEFIKMITIENVVL